MGNQLILEHNIQGREERAPLGAISFLFNIIGIIGNALVIHIFRTRLTSSSNYRIFVLLLAFVDIFLCITHIAKELNRMISVYNQVIDKGVLICAISHYVGNSVGHASLLIVLFIGFERYRKICTPFKSQITTKHSKIMCLCVVLISFVLDFPIYLIHGRRDVVVESINATRCAVKNEYDGDLLQFVYYAFIFVEALIDLVVIVKLQVSILKALAKKAKSKKKMKNMVKSNTNESERNTNETGKAKLKNEIKDMGKLTKLESGRRTKEEGKESVEQQEAAKNRRIAKTFAIVTLFLLISFFTMTLYQTVQATRRYFAPKQKISKLEDLIEEYLPDIITFNGILNPFVYFFTDNQFYQELKKLCGRKVY